MPKYNCKLPKEVEQRLDDYIERVKKIKWFKPAKNIDGVQKLVKVALKAFGVETEIKYRQLKTPQAWGAAREAAWDIAWKAAREAAQEAAWGAAQEAAWDAAWDAAWGAAWKAAWGAHDLLVRDLPDFKKKYPNGAFINLIPLYELGLWPLGIIEGKFVIAVPPHENEFPIIK